MVWLQKLIRLTDQNLASLPLDLNCVVPENIHTPTTEGIGNSEGEGGQRPRKFQRGGELYDRFSFQKSFDSIWISKIFSYPLSRTFT